MDVHQVIVGSNGSGKSTVLKLILRLYDPTEGTILVNDKDIRTLKLADLRECVSVLFQDYTHFPLSVSDALTYFHSILTSLRSETILPLGAPSVHMTAIKSVKPQDLVVQKISLTDSRKVLILIWTARFGTIILAFQMVQGRCLGDL